MEHKRTKKHENGVLYIAICCCMLVIALVGYANSISNKNQEKEKLLTQQAGENIIADETQPLPEEENIENTSNENSTNETQEIIADEINTQSVSKKEVKNEPLFMCPVSGNVIGEFSADKPIFHKSTDDYRTHNGVDIQGSVGDSVSACADGVIKEVYKNSLGYTIVLDHSDNLLTIYSNLDEKPTVSLGDSVKKGDVIGHIGTSAIGDLVKEPHLHFEVMQDGKYKKPEDYLY